MKKTVAIMLAGLGILLAGAAETVADPLVVKQGFFQTFAFFQEGTFSGDDFAVSDLVTGGGTFFGQVFVPNNGILTGEFGTLATINIPIVQGTIHIGAGSCPTTFEDPQCGGFLTFQNPPITIPSNFPADDNFFGEAPFTMVGQLEVGNLTVAIEGSGIVHAGRCTSFGQPGPCFDGSFARYEFAAPEPSTLVLMLSGLVAVGLSRWRGGKRARSSRSTAAAN
jgi:hypothetical protein